jgi:RNase H-like domain found in reverse transcriptase
MRKDVPWNWSHTQEAAVAAIKTLITKAPVLAFYDPKKELTLENDASEYGLGSVSMQDGRPISYASRSLTDTEKLYAQIEKEMMALVYGLEKNHHFTYGRPVRIITDHKPLVAIVAKPLSKAKEQTAITATQDTALQFHSRIQAWQVASHI